MYMIGIIENHGPDSGREMATATIRYNRQLIGLRKPAGRAYSYHERDYHTKDSFTHVSWAGDTSLQHRPRKLLPNHVV
jgi:hypothetical protein